ncbi:MAG: hypothetical protein ACU0DW_09860, partial [Shimia sp.]
MPTAIPLGRFGPVKVWSVVMTILGDLAPDGDLVPGPELSALAGGLGLQPQAIRTALHRLRAEDWIASERRGRHAHHRLSPKGVRETREVWSKVYGPAPDMPALVVNLHEAPVPGLRLREGVTLGPAAPEALHALLPE